MADVGKVRKLLVTVQGLAIYLTNEEISDIGKVLLRATVRMEKESDIDVD